MNKYTADDVIYKGFVISFEEEGRMFSAFIASEDFKCQLVVDKHPSKETALSMAKEEVDALCDVKERK